MEKKHGVSGYTRKCRCEVCRDAWSAYQRDYRAKRKRAAAAARYYDGPFVTVCVHIPALDAAILERGAERTGQPKDDLVCRLVREHAAAVRFEARVQ